MGFIKRVLWIVLTVAIAYGCYLAYINWWSKGGSYDEKKQAAQQYVTQKKQEVGTQVNQKVQQYTGEVVTEAKKSTLDYMKEKVSSGLTSVGKSIMGSAESLVGASSTAEINPVTVSSITGGGNTLPLPTGDGYKTPATPATISTKVNAPLIFSVNRGASYTVDWGDTANEKGTVESESVRLLSHAWTTVGDFVVKLSVRGGGVSQDYSFPIRVYE